jgi:2-methylisocitrate lyase-like PEP mutase family enzyme
VIETIEKARAGVAPPATGHNQNSHPENSKSAPPSQLLQREALQELGVALAGWGHLAARAAYVAPADEVLGIFRGARKTILVALEEAKTLLEIEGAK